MTYHVAWVVNNCGSVTKLRARSHDELWATIEEGQRRGLWGSVRETDTEEGVDWEKEDAKARAWYNRQRAGEETVPPEDQELLAWAKDLPADQYREIDPDLGKMPGTRHQLHELRNEKMNKIFAAYWRMRQNSQAAPPTP